MSTQAAALRMMLPALVVGLVGCDGPVTTDTSAPAPSPAIMDPQTIARKVVAERLGIADDDVRIISVVARDFSDSSLDCPEPGMSYLQVITPGHQVIVEADGRRFDVRVAGEHGRICYRRKPGAPPPDDKPRESIAAIVDLARSDLARRLDASQDSIGVLGVQPLAAGQDQADCPANCEPDATGCGYLIHLYYDGRDYRYHAGEDQAVPCTALLPS